MEPGDQLASVVHDITTTLEHEGNVHAVFGEPMKLDTRTVIPVATITMGGGAGGIRAFGAAVDTIRRWFSRKPIHVTPGRTFVGGGGGGIDIRPVGFMVEENGHVVFTPIDDGRHRTSPRVP